MFAQVAADSFTTCIPLYKICWRISSPLHIRGVRFGRTVSGFGGGGACVLMRPSPGKPQLNQSDICFLRHLLHHCRTLARPSTPNFLSCSFVSLQAGGRVWTYLPDTLAVLLHLKRVVASPGSIRQTKGYHWFGDCYIACEATAALLMEGANSLIYTAPPSGRVLGCAIIQHIMRSSLLL